MTDQLKENDSVYSFFKQNTETLSPCIDTPSGYAKAIDDHLIQFFDDGVKPATNKLSPMQRHVLVGLMLGDGHLVPSQVKHNRENPVAYRLVLLQSDFHKDYLFHLYELFKDLTRTPPQYYEFSDKRNPSKIYKRWAFSTILQPCLRFYGQQFYQYDKFNAKYHRVVPKNICRLIEASSLAYWYMDDGAAKWQGKSLGLRYCTDSFSAYEIRLLVDCLKNKFQLECSTQKKGGKERIYVKQKSYYKIKNLIFEHLIPSMLYKFPREYVIKKKRF